MPRPLRDCGQLDIVLALTAVGLIFTGTAVALACWKPWRWFQ